MFIVRSGNIQVAAADIVHGFVVDKEGTVGVLDGAVSREHSVVGFYNRGGDARGRVNGEFELALLAVVGGQALKEQSAES